MSEEFQSAMMDLKNTLSPHGPDVSRDNPWRGATLRPVLTCLLWHDRKQWVLSKVSPLQRSTKMDLDCVFFTLIIDDIVFPDGSSCMAQLGGGGSQSIFGFQLVSSVVNGQHSRVGLAAGIGPDMPQACRDWLEGIGADTSGLIMHSRPTPRAWQIFEQDGRRTQVYRHPGDPCDDLFDMLRPKFDGLPDHFKHARSFHLGVHPLHPPLKLLRKLREAAHARGGLLSVEPYTAAEQRPTSEQLVQLLSACDIFSPNELEAESLVGPGTPEELVCRLLDAAGEAGATTIVLRRGELGVLAATRTREPGSSEGQLMAWAVPAVDDTRVVDVTGCGNAFCGGFLASHVRPGGASLLESTLLGNVAASFMAEEKGAPATPTVMLKAKAEQRLSSVRPKAKEVRLRSFVTTVAAMSERLVPRRVATMKLLPLNSVQRRVPHQAIRSCLA